MNDRLVTLRLNRGLSARSAAMKIGIARDTYASAERDGMPHPATAKKIADFYNVQVTDLWPVEPRTMEPAA